MRRNQAVCSVSKPADLIVESPSSQKIVPIMLITLSQVLCCSSIEVIGLCVAFAGIVYGFTLTSVLFTAASFGERNGEKKSS
jgi:hypothetical protein